MINLKLNITENELKAAQALAIRLKTQDNRGTALPICFLLQDVEERRAFGNGEFLLFTDTNDREWRGISEPDIKRQILAERRDEIERQILAERRDKIEEFEPETFYKKEAQLEDEIALEILTGICYEMNHEFVTKRIFLTEEAANNHLKSNIHHYSNKARIYRWSWCIKF